MEATNMTNSIPKHAVVITFSWHPQVSVLLFDDWRDAMTFIKTDIEDESASDVENGWDSETVIYEDEGRAVLTRHWSDADDITEWKIGTVFDPKDVEEYYENQNENS